MHDRRLNALLRRSHGDRSRPPRAGHRTELEDRLVAGYHVRRPRHRRWLMLLNPWNRNARFALVALALVVLGVGACTTSTTTELEVGQKMTIDLTAKSEVDLAQIDADVTRYLDTRPGIEGVNISVSESTDGAVVYEILAMGTGLDQAQLLADLRGAVPALADADIAVEALTGSFEESFASKLKREVFQLEVAGATAEEIRAAVLAQLAAQGQENAVVDVKMGDGTTDISITVEDDGK